MKHINQLMKELVNRLDKKDAEHRRKEAHKKGIAEARRILAS